jgi:hypothetical protein
MAMSRRNALMLSLLAFVLALPVVWLTHSALVMLVPAAISGWLLWNCVSPPPESVSEAVLSPAHDLPYRRGTMTMRQMQLEQAKMADSSQKPREGSVFRGALGVLYPAQYKPHSYDHNAYNNPSTFDYDVAVRSAAPTGSQLVKKEDNFTARMYNPVGQIPEDMIMYPLPDPTLQARLPTFADAQLCDRGFLATTDPMRIIPQGLGQKL